VLVLAVAVAVIAAISLTTLALTLSLAREVRRHPAYAEQPPQDLLDDAIGLQPGEAFPVLHVTAVDGTAITQDMVATDRLLVGFFVANCPGCRGAVRALAGAESLNARLLGVVAGNRQAAEGLITQLVSAGIPTVAGPDADLLASACRVDLFPTFTLFARGQVVGSGLGESGAKSLVPEDHE